MLCERCHQWSAFYELYGEKLCDFCLMAKKTELIGQDYSSHISLPVKRLDVEERELKVNTSLSQTKLKRTLIDFSPVSGSNVYALITDFEVTPEFFENDIKHTLNAGPFSSPRFVLCRPIFKEEKCKVQNGELFKISDANESDATDTLDVLFGFLTSLQEEKHLCRITGRKYDFGKFISNMIGLQYYDCMHDGMKVKLISLCKTLIRILRPSLNTEVYPSFDGSWHTLGHWMMEVDQFPEVRLDVMPQNVIKALTE